MDDEYIGLGGHQSTIVMAFVDALGKHLMKSVVKPKSDTTLKATQGRGALRASRP
jgi:hypothetical protein